MKQILLTLLILFTGSLSFFLESSLNETTTLEKETYHKIAAENNWLKVASIPLLTNPGQIVTFRPIPQKMSQPKETTKKLVKNNASYSSYEMQTDSTIQNIVESGNVAQLELLINQNPQEIRRKILLHGGIYLSAAVKGRHRGMLQYLLKLGININARGFKQKTALHWAVPYEKTVLFLIQSGAQVNLKDDDGKDPLQRAAGLGCVKSMEHLVAAGADVNSRDKQLVTALMWAACEGRHIAVNFLVTHGAQINAQDFKGQSALAWASAKGKTACVKELLKPKTAPNGAHHPDKSPQADPNITDNLGKRPLHWSGESKEISELLLASGAHLHARDNTGMQAIHWAAHSGSRETVAFLMDKGANLNAQDQSGRSPFSLAAAANRNDILSLMLGQEMSLTMKNGPAGNPLSQAASKGNKECVLFLLNLGTDVNAEDSCGRTALSWASAEGHDAVVKILLENKADPTICDQQGQSPLSWACFKGHQKIVSMLISRGAKVSIADKKGKTPLHWAVAFETIVWILLEHGAVVDARDKEGKDALGWAAFGGHLSVVKLLLKRGASLNGRDNKKRSALYWSIHHEGVASYLVSCKGIVIDAADDEDKTPLSWAAFEKKRKVVALLLNRGADPDMADIFGKTPLSWAAAGGDVVICKSLIDAGANVNVQDEENQCPLGWAAFHGNRDVVTLLLDSGAEVDAQTERGANALSWAAHAGHADVVDLLLERGANINSTDSEGVTILQNAVIGGSYKVVKSLLMRKNCQLNTQDTRKLRTAVSWALRMCRGSVKKNNEQNPVGVTLSILVELVKRGADSAIVDKQDRKPSYWVQGLSCTQDEKKLLLQALSYTSLTDSQRGVLQKAIQNLLRNELIEAKAADDLRTIQCCSECIEKSSLDNISKNTLQNGAIAIS